MLIDGLTGEEAKTPEEAFVPTTEPEKAVQTAKKFAQVSDLTGHIQAKYLQARDARQKTEHIWLNNIRQWRGQYTAKEMASITRAKERNVYASAIFMKITKTKAVAAQGQILDLIFENDKLPISIKATPVPEGGVADVAYIEADMQAAGISPDPYGYVGDGQEIAPGATTKDMLGGMYTRLQKYLQDKKIIKGKTPDAQAKPAVFPADEAAYKMQKTIHDQMGQTNFQRECRRSVWQTVVLGTGVMKGPLTFNETSYKYVKDEFTGKTIAEPIVKSKPKSFYVSAWNFYPDPLATSMDECEYVIERHLYNKSSLSKLRYYEGFDKEVIDFILENEPTNRTQEYWEEAIRDVEDMSVDNRYEVKEFWGTVNREMLEPLQDMLGDDLEEGLDQFQINAWVCNGYLLRLVINPLVPQRIPYYVVPFEEHNEQLWGISLVENMADTQELINTHYRMMVDNLAFAGNAVFVVNESLISPDENAEMYPGKVIRVQGGAPGQAFFGQTFPNTSQSHMMALDKARQFADEVSGQPSYSYGGVATTGSNRTASGISMLMSAAAGNIRQVVKNFDEYLFKPIGEAYYAWNRLYNDDLDIVGDHHVVAGGTAALVGGEVLSQRLLQYMQTVGGIEPLAVQTNWGYANQEFAKSLGLDPDKLQADAALQTLNMQMMAELQKQQAEAAALGEAPAPEGQMASGPQDQTGGGGGTISPGMGTTPNESQFTGNA